MLALANLLSGQSISPQTEGWQVWFLAWVGACVGGNQLMPVDLSPSLPSTFSKNQWEKISSGWGLITTKKHSALEWLCQKNGIPFNENDLSLLAWSEHQPLWCDSCTDEQPGKDLGLWIEDWVKSQLADSDLWFVITCLSLRFFIPVKGGS